MRANIAAYQTLCRAMDTIKHVECYKSDLYRVDREYLMGTRVDAPESFGFVMRYNGTQLDDPRRQDWRRSTLERSYRETWGVQNCRFFWYAYGELKEYAFECYLDRWEDWHRFYNRTWNPAWDSYFRPQQ